MCNVRLGYFLVTHVYIHTALAKNRVQSEQPVENGFLEQ